MSPLSSVGVKQAHKHQESLRGDSDPIVEVLEEDVKAESELLLESLANVVEADSELLFKFLANSIKNFEEDPIENL